MSPSQEVASREIFWNLQSPMNRALMYGVFAIAMLICLNGIFWKVYFWAKGRKTRADLPLSIKGLLGYLWKIGAQRTIQKDRQSRSFHHFLFFGFLVLTFTTTIVFLDYDLGFSIYKGNFYLALTLLSDIFGLLFIIGLSIALSRRLVSDNDRLHFSKGDMLFILLLLIISLQGFVLEGLRIHATNDPWAAYSPIGLATAKLFWGLSVSSSETLHFTTWWVHAISVFVLFALLPYTKFFHVISSSALLCVTADARRSKMTSPGDMEELMERLLSGAEEELKLGIQSVEDLSWLNKLELDACTACGRCQEVCPAYRTEKPLSPKWIILDTKDHNALTETVSPEAPAFLRGLFFVHERLTKALGLALERDEDTDKSERAKNEAVQNAAIGVGKSREAMLAGEVIDENAFWSCTSCMACVEACPVGIDHLDIISESKRSLTLLQGKLPREAQAIVKSLEARSNPFGDENARTDWTNGIDVPIAEKDTHYDILYWVGCISAYDTRKQSIARSMATILNRLDLSWAILGKNECCSGDPARRLGEETIFQSLAKKNATTLNDISFEKIVANCPHCFHSLKNEYPDVVSKSFTQLPIVHHTEFIAESIRSGALKVPRSFSEEVTFHDPCYLARYNNITEEPREVLVSIGATNKEMKESGKKGMCCGAGGGNYWMDLKLGSRVNALRAEQAIETGAKTIATGCPFCLQMMEDGLKTVNQDEHTRVKDIAELVAESLE